MNKQENKEKIKIFIHITKETQQKLDAFARKTKLKKGQIVDRLVESLLV